MTAQRNKLINACLLLYYHDFTTPIDDIIKKAEKETKLDKFRIKFWYKRIPSIRDCIESNYSYGAVKYQATKFAEEVRQICRKNKIKML